MIEPASADEARTHAATLQASGSGFSNRTGESGSEGYSPSSPINRSFSKEIKENIQEEEDDNRESGLRKRLKAASRKTHATG